MIWSKEYVPPELVRASFVMLFKNKGSVNDPSKYTGVLGCYHMRIRSCHWYY